MNISTCASFQIPTTNSFICYVCRLRKQSSISWFRDLPCCSPAFAKNIQGNLHPLLIISKGYFALLNGPSPFLAFRRKYPFQAYILYGMWERQRPVLVEDKTWIIAPPHTRKKWQGSLLVCSEERSFQCVTLQSRPKPTMQRDTRGKRRRSSLNSTLCFPN